MVYYTEYPCGEFKAEDDVQALAICRAAVIYRDSLTENGLPVVILRDIPPWVDIPQNEEDTLP
jgi:hypothetical protein